MPKGTRKAKEEKPAQPATDTPAIPEELLRRVPQRWVQVHFKLLVAHYLNDFVRLPQTATLHAVEAHLIAHHGGAIANLVLYKDQVKPDCLLRDRSLTLREVWKLNDADRHVVSDPCGSPAGALGGTRRSYASVAGDPEDHQVVLCYDYKAHQTDCALITRSPHYCVRGFNGGTPTRGFVGLADDAEAKRAKEIGATLGDFTSPGNAPSTAGQTPTTAAPQHRQGIPLSARASTT